MFKTMLPPVRIVVALSVATLTILGRTEFAPAQNYATSDNQSGYVHWIELRDASGRTIAPDDDDAPPYSPQQTCGRCHDFNTISHGWHFDAVEQSSRRGRPGQPWIWSDLANGIHMPLSYRDWQGTFNPDKLEISRWQMAEKFGGFLPGGGPGSAASLEHRPEFKLPTWKDPKDDDEPETDGEAVTPEHFVDLSNVTGELPVDCMLCHHRPGSGYSPFAWTEQIEDRNFAYAPTVAMGIGTVDKNSLRLKDDFDRAEDADKLPKITYDAQRFRHDGMIFFDLVRKPSNDSCYYCHTNISTDTATGGRWLHDEDVHVRAGIACADCHRNGLDHETVRGFVGEQHPSASAESFSCQGCHLGSDGSGTVAGRLGAPKPLHKGLPPLHFEKLSCTACHSGKLPSDTLPRQFNSIAHRLGEHVRRNGDEAPGIVASALLPLDWHPPTTAEGDHSDDDSDVEASGHPSAKLTPHRMMWPSYWGLLTDSGIQPLNPEQAREIVRKGLRTKRDFTEDLAKVKLSSSQKKEALGDRYRTKEEEWTEEEKAKVESLTKKLREEQITEKMVKALKELEEGFPESIAVYITGGQGFALGEADDLRELSADELGDAAEPYAWPMAHSVRPASQSLGIGGCTDCHRTDAPLFATQVRPVGLLPDQETEAFAISNIQGLDVEKLSIWNSMFDGRSVFKIFGLIALGLTCVVAVSACAVNLSSFWRR
ncbi:MAG TPA: hypothetical protein DDW52_24205 [Planctomycetaceae bacterium]|nr:hypothetical protein [Planctomycetaceae bacterium]